MGSLVAILALAGLAALMKLGGESKLESHADIRRAAGEVVDGFEAVETAAARDGSAALARDAEARIMLIKRHGNRFAGRVLTSQARVRRNGETLEVDCGERRFGVVCLTLDNAASWQARSDAMGHA
ncbi:MAG: hypothetical protein RIC82_08255 [Parvibaculum sp.]